MQSDYKTIYKMTAERTGKSEQMYKDLGNFVFAQLYKNFRNPKSIIIKLKGIGFWYLRKKRLEILLTRYAYDPEKGSPFEDEEQTQEVMKLRLEDYKRYTEDKAEIRKKRNETQTLLKVADREDKSD